MKLALPIIHKQQSGSLIDFIAFWSKLYAYDNRELYHKIHHSTLSVKDLEDLYKWKNGMKLSDKKAKSLQTKIIAKIDIINKLKQDEEIDVDAFRVEFKEVSAVWLIFLLHILKPSVYPIYDQHIHRAYRFMNNQSTEGISANITKKRKLAFYFEEYLPFVQAQGVKDLKQMDEAFFAFGQFINIGNQKMIVT